MTKQSGDLFDDLFQMFFRDFPISYVRTSYEGWPISNALVNEKTGDLRIEVAITGYDPKEIEVSLDGRTLIIRGKIEDQKDDGYKYIHRRIKDRTNFERRFSLPREVNLDKITIRNKNGLLIIDIPFDKDKTSEKKLIIE